jgi:hypothetical protein
MLFHHTLSVIEPLKRRLHVMQVVPIFTQMLRGIALTLACAALW